MALAGDLTQPATAANRPGLAGYRLLARHTITRITNRAIRIGHRMIGFGTAATDDFSPDGFRPDGFRPDGFSSGELEAYCHVAPAEPWAELAAELRLRRAAQQAGAAYTSRI